MNKKYKTLREKLEAKNQLKKKDILDELDTIYLRVKLLIQKSATNLYKKLEINEEQKRKYFTSSKKY